MRANTPDGSLEVRADLVVGCDGRHSIVRERAGLRVDDIGAPMDVLWFRVPKKPRTRMSPWAGSSPGASSC